MDARSIRYVRKKNVMVKKFGRKSSYIELLDCFDDPVTTLYPVNKLGSGTYGSVWLFKNGDKAVAVKKVRSARKEFETKLERDIQHKHIENEFLFTKLAYPHDGVYHLEEFLDDSDEEAYVYDYRMLLPYHKGKNFHQVPLMQLHPDLLFYLFYKIAKEVFYLHRHRQILHGDLSPSNIIITPDLAVKLIDFYFAYHANGFASTVDLDAGTQTYLAPERINATKPIPAHASQDIYTLAYTFKNAYRSSLNYTEQIKFLKKYPCIDEFVTAGLNPNPVLRQSLTSLLMHMKKQMFIPRLLAYAHTNKQQELRFMLIGGNYNRHRDDILLCILGALKRRYTDEASNIIKLLSNNAEAEGDKPILSLLYYILLLTQSNHAKSANTNLFQDTRRKELINEIIISFKLAKWVLLSPAKPITPEFDDIIRKSAGLIDIYQNLIDNQRAIPPQYTPLNSPKVSH